MGSPGPRGIGLGDVDHVRVPVPDVDEAVQLLTTLGLTVAPPQWELDPDGVLARLLTDARHVLFRPVDRSMANFLVLGRGGDPVLVCYAPDPEDTHVRLLRLGVAAQPPRTLPPRIWTDPESGQPLPVHARQLMVTDPLIPLRISGFTTATPETYQHRAFTTHPNGAGHILGVTWAVDDLSAAVDWLSGPVFALPAQLESPKSAVIRPRDLFIRIVSGPGAMCAVSIGVPDIADVRKRAQAGAVPHHVSAAGHVVVRFGGDSPVLLQFELSTERHA